MSCWLIITKLRRSILNSDGPNTDPSETPYITFELSFGNDEDEDEETDEESNIIVESDEEEKEELRCIITQSNI